MKASKCLVTARRVIKSTWHRVKARSVATIAARANYDVRQLLCARKEISACWPGALGSSSLRRGCMALGALAQRRYLQIMSNNERLIFERIGGGAAGGLEGTISSCTCHRRRIRAPAPLFGRRRGLSAWREPSGHEAARP